MLLIPIPRDVGPGDFRRLRTHAAWYRRQVEIHGPSYGAKSRERARRRDRRIREEATPTPSRIGPVL